MQLSPEEIGKKLREFQPAYAGAKLGDMELGSAYLKKYGPVSMPDSTNKSSDPILPGQASQIASQAVSGGGSVNDLASSLVQKYFPKDQWANAMKVMQGESGGRADAVGDNYPIKGQTIPSYGLFQIRALPGRPKPEVLLNPEENVKYAANLYKAQGWKPWTAARKLGIK